MHCLLLGIVISCVLLANPQPLLSSPLEVEVTEKFAPELVEWSNFGYSIAANNGILLIAAPNEVIEESEYGSGAVYVYRMDPDSKSWIPNGRLTHPTLQAGASFGESLAISGSTVVVGAPGGPVNGHARSGSVYVYEIVDDFANNWVLPQTLVDGNPVSTGQFGKSVDIEEGILVIGVPGGGDAGFPLGKVSVYGRTGLQPNLWEFETDIMDEHGLSHDAFGEAVAIDCGQILVGAPEAEICESRLNCPVSGTGMAFIFSRDSSSGEWRQGKELLASTGKRGDDFGASVTLKGSTAVVGAPKYEDESADLNDSGAVFVFDLLSDADTLHETHLINNSLPESRAYFGGSVVMEEDFIAVGAVGATVNEKHDQGIAFLFEPDVSNPGRWQETTRIYAYDGFGDDEFGADIAIADQQLIIGADRTDSSSGSAYVYRPSPDPQETHAGLIPPALPLTDAISIGAPEATRHDVRISASNELLEQPLGLWIYPIPSLPQGLIARSRLFNLGSERTLRATEEDSILISLAVPEDADSEHLRLAVLVEPGTGENEQPDDFIWVLIRGIYNEESRSLTVDLGGLSAQGNLLQLVELPSSENDDEPVDPPTDSSSFLLDFPGISEAYAQGTLTTQTFDVDCYDFNPGCGLAEENLIAATLTNILNEFRLYGFNVPNLNKSDTFTNGIYPYHRIYIYADTSPECEGIKGKYKQPNIFPLLYVCLPPNAAIAWQNSGMPSETLTTLRHELFHAVQANYHSSLYTAYNDIGEKWIVEAQASVVGASRARLERHDLRDPHKIHLTLTKEEYMPQDFWLFLGRKRYSDWGYAAPADVKIEYLNRFLLAGYRTAEVDGELKKLQGYGLVEAYWDWIKDQAIEHETIDNSFADFTLSTKCRPYSLTADSREYYKLTYPDDFTFNSEKRIDTLDSLSARIVEITFPEDFWQPDDGESSAIVDISAVAGGNAKINYKVYVGNRSECVSDPDNMPKRVSYLAPASSDSSPERIYLLVASTRLEGNTVFKVIVQQTEPDPEEEEN